MGKYIDRDILIRALSLQTIKEIFDDDNSGVLNELAISDVIDDAEAEVDSFLVGIYVEPKEDTDRLLKRAAKDFAISFCFERHPEYVRTFGEETRAERWKRGKDRMMMIRAGLRNLPDQPSPAVAPKNSGGLIFNNGPYTTIDDPNGNQNGSGF